MAGQYKAAGWVLAITCSVATSELFILYMDIFTFCHAFPTMFSSRCPFNYDLPSCLFVIFSFPSNKKYPCFATLDINPYLSNHDMFLLSDIGYYTFAPEFQRLQREKQATDSDGISGAMRQHDVIKSGNLNDLDRKRDQGVTNSTPPR